jgi:SAM-dependent methyltransferase
MSSLANRGLLGTVDQWWTIALDYWFDARWGVETRRDVKLSSLDIQSKNLAVGNGYKATRLRPFRAALNDLQPDRRVGFIDFGSGKGKVLLLAAQAGFARITGVEFSRELCVVARQNVDLFQSRAHKGAFITVVHGDAGDCPIAHDDNFFHFFFPFQEPLMSGIIDRIVASIDEHPRKIFILYNNPQCRGVLDRRSCFRLVFERDYWGSVFTAYVAGE